MNVLSNCGHSCNSSTTRTSDTLFATKARDLCRLLQQLASACHVICYYNRKRLKVLGLANFPIPQNRLISTTFRHVLTSLLVSTLKRRSLTSLDHSTRKLWHSDKLATTWELRAPPGPFRVMAPWRRQWESSSPVRDGELLAQSRTGDGTATHILQSFESKCLGSPLLVELECNFSIFSWIKNLYGSICLLPVVVILLAQTPPACSHGSGDQLVRGWCTLKFSLIIPSRIANCKMYSEYKYKYLVLFV
jgi:hypothetical protein